MFKKLLSVSLVTLTFGAALWFTPSAAEAQKKGWYQYSYQESKPQTSQPAPTRTEIVVPQSPNYIYSETDPEFYFTEYTDPEYYYTTQQDPTSFVEQYDYETPTYYYWYPVYRERWLFRRR